MASSRLSSLVLRRCMSSAPVRDTQVLKEKITYTQHDLDHMNNWLKIFGLFFIPAIGLTYANSFIINHESHEPPPFEPYDYLRRRHRIFPWRDGVKNFIYNPKVNPLPDGFEEVDK